MHPSNYDQQEVHRQFNDALKRAARPRRQSVRIGTLVHLAQQGGYIPPIGTMLDDEVQQPARPRFDLDAARPLYSPTGMPARKFAGPRVGDARLFPLNAMSLFVSLGGVGKTTAIIKLAAHIAAGRVWGADPVKRRRVIIFAIEETKDELDRKFGAAIHDWNPVDKMSAEENLRLVSCLDRDARLTAIQGRAVHSTGVADEIIYTAQQFGAELIVLDHLQGFVSGDLNHSDTATVLAQEANKIVSETGAAVVLTAHTNKASIAAQEVGDGFTTGSLAFENAARQVVGMIPLPEDDAKRLKLEQVKSQYFQYLIFSS